MKMNPKLKTKAQTDKREIENPSMDDIKRLMNEVKQDRGGAFLILERTDGVFIQGFCPEKKEKINLKGVDPTKDWYIEKPISGYNVEKPVFERYSANFSTDEALKIFTSFLKGANWETLTQWSHIVEEEKFFSLSREEIEALHAIIPIMLEVADTDFISFVRELAKDLSTKGAIRETHIITLGAYLSGYLEQFDENEKPQGLVSVYTKCKEYDSNIP